MGEVNDLKLSATNGPANPVKRVCCSREQLETFSREELLDCWVKQDSYVDSLETQLATLQTNNGVLEEKLRNLQAEAARRENLLLMKLGSKEQEAQDLMVQIQELKMSHVSNEASLRCSLLDPAVNVVIQRLRQELDKTKSLLEETQNELSAWKFTPDSNTGKRLMAKCRLLYQENEELGRITSVGRLAKLEGDLALQKNFSEEMKKSQSELDEFLQELDEDVEGMQSTIYYLQQQLRQARDQLAELKTENEALRKGGTSSLSGVQTERPESPRATSREINNLDPDPSTVDDAEPDTSGPASHDQEEPPRTGVNHHASSSTFRSGEKIATDGVSPQGDINDRTSVSRSKAADEESSDSARTEKFAPSGAVSSDKCRKRTASQSQVDCDLNHHVPATNIESKEPHEDETNSHHVASKRPRRDSTDSSHVTNGQTSPPEGILPNDS